MRGQETEVMRSEEVFVSRYTNGFHGVVFGRKMGSLLSNSEINTDISADFFSEYPNKNDNDDDLCCTGNLCSKVGGQVAHRLKERMICVE